MTLIALDELIRTDKRDAAYYSDDELLNLIEKASVELAQLRAELDVRQTLLDESIRKGLQLCEQNGNLLMEAHDKDALLEKMFQALAGVLGDIEHRGVVRPVVHKACEDAVCRWLEMTQPKEKK